jgi:signal transduction histidine kinase/CheY-like chemotaxis protein
MSAPPVPTASTTPPIAPAAAPAAAATPPGTVIGPAQRATIERKARIELVRMAYSQLTLGTVSTAIATVAFALIVAGHPGTELLSAWIAAIVLPLAWRAWLARAFHRATPEQIESPRWGLLYIAATSATAALWGVTPWLFPILNEPGTTRLAHVLLLAGLVSASVRMLLPLRKGAVLYVSLMMGPIAAVHFATGEMDGMIIGLCILYFVVYTIWTTQHSHRALSDALVIGFEREEIAAELAAEISRRESRESELREAREKAESASRAKGEFLATISHEIRTPMNGVLGMLRVVRDTPLSNEQRGYLKTASDSAESLLLLLNDVLDFSKIEAGRLELEHAPFPPATTARAVTDLLHARARDKGLQLELHLGENLPGVILGDGTRLRQILVNLIGNAIKFTERGRVDLTVTCAERTPTKAVMHYTVTDTGIGMDSAALSKLFKPFTQADTSMSRRYGGTGLGLAISQRLTQSMGGALQVQSAIGQGTTFRLILPCQLPDITVVQPRLEEAPKFVTPVLQGRVLVVEDDSVNQQVIDLFLKKLNITPKFANDGEAGVIAATSETFDVVLMDCQLPGIDGMEATRRIREKLDGKPLKIIALTANASTHVREACLAAGMNDFLSKPVRFELLATILQRNLPTAR